MAIRFKNLNRKSTNVRDGGAKRTATRLLLKGLWRIAPAKAMGLVEQHAFRPAGYRTRAAETRMLGSGEPFQVDVHGLPVQGWTWGRGPGILFVHGWNGRGIQLRHFFEPLLKAGFGVMAFDAPGHGESGGETSSYFQFTDAVRAVMNADIGSEINGLVGHSLGGAAVVNALSKENRAIPAVLLAPALQMEEILLSTFDLYGIPQEIFLSALAAYEKRYGYTLKGDDPHKLLPAVDAEVLIVHDDQDREIPFPDSKRAAARWPHVHLHATSGFGHRRLLADAGSVHVVVNYLVDRTGVGKTQPLEPIHRTEAVGSQEKIVAAL